MPKQFILNAQNFGQSKESNRAVLEGYNNGFLSSAGICANGAAVDSALNEILPECPNLSIGIMLNLTGGLALTKNELLTDGKNRFKYGFVQIWLKSYNNNFMTETEKEFRCQIETLLQHTKVDFLSSVNDIHLVPEVFNLSLKLAKEYDIPFVTTRYEEPYFVPDLFKHLNIRYLVNIFKLPLLNLLSKKNRQRAESFGIRTNSYFVGNAYNSMVNSEVIKNGLEAIDGENYIVEAEISPCIYKKSKHKKSVSEFLVTMDKELLDSIERMGFEVTNYRKLR